MTTEQVIFDDQGRLVTDNIWTYKPPAPRRSRSTYVSRLLEHDRNSLEAQVRADLLAVSGSKSTAEPTMSLGVSAYFAIKRAVREAHRELTGRHEWLRMDVPATCQVIQTRCGVSVDRMTLE